MAFVVVIGADFGLFILFACVTVALELALNAGLARLDLTFVILFVKFDLFIKTCVLAMIV